MVTGNLITTPEIEMVGTDDADNEASTTNIVANADGSMLERLEHLKDEVGDKYNSTKNAPSEENMQLFIDFAKDNILEGIKEDLKDFSVGFDNWYSEKNLHDKN